jgi:hypothetical protein
MSKWSIIDAAAAELGVSKAARAKWLVRNKVPHYRRLPIMQALAARGVILAAEDFDRLREPKPDAGERAA